MLATPLKTLRDFQLLSSNALNLILRRLRKYSKSQFMISMMALMMKSTAPPSLMMMIATPRATDAPGVPPELLPTSATPLTMP